ncbi:Glucose-6-phosphate dehydrogenase, NAD binding domain [Candidatus Electrothrix communis]|uniref:Glucose-6-phosphate dehydrogenase, NAD binding domain n=1 Tax=Candidatus Electrothrix communis TaxID=1859133 RepID=A0A444J693_9BACT|nr:Glucose-6-phosphate dehydrogenase, NAD binding domain [Candidatus Electrothrix communis]
MVMEKRSCDFIIFGVMGDLAQRKLLPSLYQLEKSGLLNYDTRIVGVARHELDQEAFQTEDAEKAGKVC